MMSVRTLLTPLLIVAVAALAGSAAEAQLADRKALTLDGVKRIMAAAEKEAVANKWNVAIAIVDEAGELLMFQKMDDVQVASVDIALGKARSAARFRRPTKALEDTVAKGRTTLMAVEGVLPLEGGVPIVVDGRVIGAVGVSGVASQDDARIAEAGIAALGVK
jgi:glc operon protein GlcG